MSCTSQVLDGPLRWFSPICLGNVSLLFVHVFARSANGHYWRRHTLLRVIGNPSYPYRNSLIAWFNLIRIGFPPSRYRKNLARALCCSVFLHQFEGVYQWHIMEVIEIVSCTSCAGRLRYSKRVMYKGRVEIRRGTYIPARLPKHSMVFATNSKISRQGFSEATWNRLRNEQKYSQDMSGSHCLLYFSMIHIAHVHTQGASPTGSLLLPHHLLSSYPAELLLSHLSFEPH